MSYNQTIQTLREQFRGLIWNPKSYTISLDDPSINPLKNPGEEFNYQHEIMNVEDWGRINSLLPEQKGPGGIGLNQSGQAAAAALEQDPLRSLEAFKGPFADLANDFFGDLLGAVERGDYGQAGAYVTSKDYSVLQSTIILGESTHPIVQGVLSRFWDDVPTPQLRGDWLDITDAVAFNLNVPDGKSVEPSKGAATKLISVVVPKHQGSVGQTFRASVAINTRNVYQELSARLAQRRLVKENALVATTLDGTSNVDSTHGLDFGERAGSGTPWSTKVPNDFNQYFIDLFSGLGVPWDQIAVRNIIFNEYGNNSWNTGLLEPTSAVQTTNAVGPNKGLNGVTWFRDEALPSATKGWIANRDLSGRIFRGPVRSFDVVDDEAENNRTVLKSYMIPRRLDDTYLIEVTGLSA